MAVGVRVGFPLARVWWTLRRPRHEGALVEIRVGTALLLVRASYRKAWSFPGGGVRRGETPEQAARRELAEELSLSVAGLREAAVVCGNWDGRRERVHFFELPLERLPELRLDNREIVAARLVPAAALRALRLTGPVTEYLRTRVPAAAAGQTQGSGS